MENKDDDLKLTFENLMNKKESIHDYWIDGHSYEMREEIKSWGGYWNPDKKRWQIDGLDLSDCDEHLSRIFRVLGLRLIKRGPND